MARSLSWFFGALSLVVSSFAVAQPQPGQGQGLDAVDPYSFQSSCSGKGMWTDAALEGSRKLYAIVNNIKNDPNCQGVGTALKELVAKTDEMMKDQPGWSDKSSQLSNIPEEMRALRGLVTSSSVMQEDIFKLLMNRGLKGAMLAAEVGASPAGSVDGTNLIPLAERTRRSSVAGLNLIDALTKQLPSLDGCLSNPDLSGQVFAGMIQMAAAFVSSQPGATRRTAEVVSNLATMVRQRKYSGIARKIKEAEFMTSVTCLIEAVSENYCATNDAIKLFDEMNQEMSARAATNRELREKSNQLNREGLVVQNPFAGYYLMIQEVPIVTNWIQKVLIGSEPQTNQDAKFQTDILNDMNTYLMLLKTVQGTYNINLKTLETIADPQQKRYQIMTMMEQLNAQLTMETFAKGGGGGLNFFTQVVKEPMIPFFLLEGRAYVPPEVSGLTQGLQAVEWPLYVLDGGRFGKIPGFSDPTQLVKQIKINLDTLIVQATIAANRHFNNFFIVDKASLVVESDNAVRLSVFDSLRNIYKYLANLALKVEKNGEYKALPAIRETQTRIMRVLESYRKLDQIRAPKVPMTDEQIKVISEAYSSVLLTVFEEFNIRLQRSGYLAERMSQFVTKDYTMMLKSGFDFSPFRKELFYYTGQGMLDRMVQLYSSNPADTQADMMNAASLTKKSIARVEELIARPLRAEMAQMDMITRGVKPTAWNIKLDSYARAYADAFKGAPELDNGKMTRRGKSQMEKEEPVRGFLRRRVYSWIFPTIPATVLDRVWSLSEQYPTSLPADFESVSLDDEHGSVAFNLTKLCVQSLAFNDWKAFIPFCEGRVLYPFYHNERRTPFAKLDRTQQEITSRVMVNYNAKGVQHLGEALTDLAERERTAMREALNNSARICAYRDWRRRGYVSWQVMKMEQNPSTPYEIPAEDPNTPAPGSSDAKAGIAVEPVPAPAPEAPVVVPQSPVKTPAKKVSTKPAKPKN